MSEPDNSRAGAVPERAQTDADVWQSGQRDTTMGLTRRGWTITLSVIMAAVFVAVGMLVRVPYVALGPGPTYDTLGVTADGPVIKIDGTKSYETSGELRLTTVSLSDDVQLIKGLGMWISGRYALAPRELYFPPGETEQEVEEQNARQFQNSQSSAEVAALSYLDYPTKVIAQEVVSDGPSSDVLRSGDVLVAVDGTKVSSTEDVHKVLNDTRPGDVITVSYRRDGTLTRDKKVTLGDAGDGREQGYMGLLLTDRAKVDFEIDIELADIGGPSAGLMFAVAIVDRLTPGKLTGGERVAGTGEIADNGKVGPIGGIQFKLVAAKEDGATTFLVPKDNCAEAVRTAPDGMRLVRVDTLDDAVSALETIADGGKARTCAAS
ncbi:PDZ domain-containing protein [Haloechinothrix salitolerans]|uniref:endopeptidase La n=1 Tax=Haloechinothrix salitolerans TaxID=926830 RepID=A0ABW2C8V3_9PSEU